MTPAALKSALAALGIKERGLARALGVEEKTVRRWTRGERGVPASLSLLLSLALDMPPLGERLAKLAAPVSRRADTTSRGCRR